MQANSGTRQPLPELDLREAPGAGDPAVHGEAWDAPRPRLQREPVRLLQGQGRPASYTQGREREAKTKWRVSNSLFKTDLKTDLVRSF